MHWPDTWTSLTSRFHAIGESVSQTILVISCLRPRHFMRKVWTFKGSRSGGAVSLRAGDREIVGLRSCISSMNFKQPSKSRYSAIFAWAESTDWMVGRWRWKSISRNSSPVKEIVIFSIGKQDIIYVLLLIVLHKDYGHYRVAQQPWNEEWLHQKPWGHCSLPIVIVFATDEVLL